MIRTILVRLIFVSSFFVWNSFSTAQNLALPAGDFTALREGGIAQVSKVIDPLTVQLQDGRTIFLTGLYYPDFDIHEPGEFSVMARRILADMLEGQSVVLYETKTKDRGRVNRFGHVMAHLVRQSDKSWVQGTMLALGLAQVMTMQRNPEMDVQMYKVEEGARISRTGLWETDIYKVLTPEEAAFHLDSFQIVEGKIESVALKKNRLYLNFGKDWKTDFTVSIAPSDKRLFLKGGIDPMSWNGLTIRVRGWVRSYNGPYMEINHPQAIEIPNNENKS